MSIPVLIEVYDEMRRLAIAGSAVAAGDFRLKKLVPPLEKAGEKAPVFAKVAQAAQAVVESNEKTASAALLELTTLVNAILYTQGETGVAGDFKQLETTDLGGQATQTSARVLKPLLEALSTTGSGRIELVRDAHERGTFKDLRLVKPALKALDDPYPEIGEFIAVQVLPRYGRAIVPELRKTLDLEARGAGHLHRLRLLHRLDPEGSRDLVQRALEEGSKEMKVAAVECLGTSDDDLVYLLEQAKAKAKDVRAAALRALARARTTTREVVAALKKAIDGVDLELIIPRVRETQLPEIRDYVLERAEQQLEHTLALKDKQKQGPAILRLQQLVLCLEPREDARAESFLLRCFQNAPELASIKSEPSGADLNQLVAVVLSRGTMKMRRQLVAAQKVLTGPMFTSALYAARASMSAAEFYDEFSPYLTAPAGKRGKKAAPETERAASLQVVLSPTHQEQAYYHHHHAWMSAGRYVEADEGEPLPALDPRWLDAAVAADNEELVCRLARPGHAATIEYLTSKLGVTKMTDREERLRTMVRIGHPGAADALIDAIKKRSKDTYYGYVGYWLGPMIADLPRSAAEKFDALLPTLPDKMVDQLMESVLALRNKPERETIAST